jgi:hypothetical protein
MMETYAGIALWLWLLIAPSAFILIDSMRDHPLSPRDDVRSPAI